MKQPEALRIADLLERDPSEWGGLSLGWKAAAELRRLHEANQAMRDALKEAKEHIDWREKVSGTMGTLEDIYPKICAAIAKGEAE